MKEGGTEMGPWTGGTGGMCIAFYRGITEELRDEGEVTFFKKRDMLWDSISNSKNQKLSHKSETFTSASR